MVAFEFLILGPVEARADGSPLQLGGPRQRALLAYLLVNANRVVAADSLIEELWSAPPRDAVAALQNHVSRLRKVLGDRLVTKSPGYLLRTEPGELDLDRFRSLVAEAGGANDAGERSRLLRAADTLFRGAPFAEVDAPFATGEADGLEELRLAAVEARVDADLERGRHAELVPELCSLIARHPLRERLRRQYILALYRSDRQADALEAYHATRRMLDEQLGLEPSTALRELERAILRHDPELAAAEPAAPPALARTRRRLLASGALAALATAAIAATVVIMLTRTSEKPVPPPAAAAAPTPRRAAPSHSLPVTHTTSKAKQRLRARPRAAVLRTVTEPAAAPPQRPASTTRTTTTTTTTTTTAAAKTKPKSTPKPSAASPATPPATWTTLSDDFSETAPNYRLWNVSGDGSGTSYKLENGRLEFTIPASAQTGGNYDMVGPGWGTQCRFGGDFDARIDYQLLEWPPAAGAHVQLSSWIFPDVNSATGRQVNRFGDQYSGNIDQHFTLVDTTDTKGTLRLVRTAGVQSSYYLSNGKWVLLQSASAPGQAQIGIQLFGMANEWTHTEVSVAFDNFSVSAPSMTCP